MLEVKGIDSYYGHFRVLKNVFLKVEKGEFVVLLGANGHGKSTLLKTICGIMNPTAGHIIFDGQEIHNLIIEQIVEMGLVYIPEERNLFPEMTVMENLILGAHNSNARKEEAKNLDYVFELFPQLKLLEKQLCSGLSGGEQRMVAIGRGLMSSAKFLAVDEPSMGLAPNLTDQVFKTLSEVNKTGVGVLLVEQSINKVLEYADRVYVLDDGKIVFEGGKEDVLNNEQIKDILLGVYE
ncbi:MAG: ABC transporter ATP-binding protein [Desulfobacterales bacterium]|nr:ABC transporter ATP-binding protein [Desulfobacterales bacterium]